MLNRIVIQAAIVSLSSVALLLLALLPQTAVAERSLTFVYPLMGPRLSDDFGIRIHPIRKFSKQHNGVDLAAPKSALIRAVADGRVVFAGKYGGYGNLVVIEHPKHLTTHYGHCDKIRAKIGERVSAGQVVATVGSTGHSTGPHLHFEVRINGVPYDPERFIPGLAAPGEG